MSETPILKVEDIRVSFPVQGGMVNALDGVSLEVFPGEIVAVVGESGCGKTTLARAVLGLQPIVDGTITLNGDVVRGTTKDNGRRVGMVWQDPYASLNPRWTIGRSILEPATLVGEKRNAIEVMKEVGLDERFVDRYPKQLSGGQRQRVAIGRALVLQPPLVICDEPTSALDLSIRAQILNLLKDIRRERQCAFLYISHDLTTVRFLADRIAVMYLGKIVEMGTTEELFSHPRHPYTKALLDSAPNLDKLMHLPDPLPGEIPDPKEKILGCRFASRCRNVQEVCRVESPALRIEEGRTFYCHNPF
ncbi:MAG: ABC transporter ATP-binding protein [Fimbriimonadales bacterium]|nr:ABC transporter ATP-binding protein [Fimbriimonadales bacterium]